MLKIFNDKHVVITGGCSGIGLATALEFVNNGAHVSIIDNSAKNIETIKATYPYHFNVVAADVSDCAQLTQAFSKCTADIGAVDILIANAGISTRNAFINITLEQWHTTLRVNLDGVFYACQLAAKQMLERKSGVILMTASTNALTAHPLYADYNASKAALIALAKTMAVELAPHIQVNAVAPGYVLTDMQRREYSPAMLEQVNAQLPLKRHAMPEEVAKLFVYLASNAANYITGQVITIDGGETA